MLAHDKDEGENGRITYSLKGGNLRGKFFINAKTGAVYTQRSLLRGHQYNVMLFITVLDINEFYPAFSKYQYDISVPESAETGSIIFNLNATDKDVDKKLVYKIHNAKNPESLQLFTLRHNTGEVTIANSLDSADVGSFILDKEGKPLVPKAVDCDLHTNSMFTYQFFTKNLSSMFHIDPNTEENGDVHFELQNHYDIFKICPRSGNITIKQPVPNLIREYKLIVAVRDNGLNGAVRYAIDTARSEEHSHFYIKSSTGEVFLKKSLDYEVQSFFSLWIKAFDTGTPSKSTYTKLWIHGNLSVL
ncbi:unnamed protein product [Nesidiocoris tenuis]|uniref:Cadherin domain-containing protein n=1 Tax=Nesidiocoris tenuis TaxID=355587 RepID=A0A6H5GLR6_9HEMI|nr:unnamed protein product [Nesidiocoris tenuis]